MSTRRPNVAEQNEAVAADLVQRTKAFRDRAAGYPEALYGFLAAKGVDVSRSVLVSASTAEQGINPICGVVLTQDGHFMEFDLDCSPDGRDVQEVHTWVDESAGQNVNSHNPGFRKGIGCIALEVLRRFGNAG